MSGSGFPQPITYSDILLCDPLDANAVCGTSTSGISLSINSGTAISTTLVNLIAGSNTTLTQSVSGSDITISSSGGTNPCTTVAAGVWDIVPQTCAGEKVIQGIAGNATTKNFVILPASDQTALNLYSGDPSSSFTPITSFSFFGDEPLNNAFNIGSSFNRSQISSPYVASLMGYNEDHVGGSPQNPIFGVRCIGLETGGSVGTIQACEGEAYSRGTGTTVVADAFSSFVNTGGSKITLQQSGFYASRNTNTTGVTGNVHNNYGFFSENQGGVGLNNYGIFLVNAATKNSFFVASDTGHVNIPILDSAQLKGLCYNTGAIDTNATFVVSSCLQDTPSALASIGTCNAGNEGGLATVNNSTTTVLGATITGGGANHVLAYCTGSNWIVASGASSGSLSGSLSSPHLPVATGATSLADSTVTDDGTAPTRTPNGVNTALSGTYDEWVVDTGGVTANKLVCRSSSSKVQICATSTTQGVIGVAQATATSGQTVKVCWAAKCSPISSNATTAGHWLIPSTSVAGDVDDTGSTTQPTGTDTFLAESSVGGGAQVLTTLLAADTVNAAGGGKATTIQINASTNLSVSNFADGGGISWTGVNSGNTTTITATINAQYKKLFCETGLGDGLNAMAAGTYLQFFCVNRSGVTWTITGINCWTDNNGTSTLNAANNAATGLLTGAVTCNNTKSGGGAAGTQSGTTTLANNDAISFTFVADGTSKQTTWTVSITQ